MSELERYIEHSIDTYIKKYAAQNNKTIEKAREDLIVKIVEKYYRGKTYVEK